MRECSEDVRLGMIRLSSSLLAGRESPERGLEVKEGAIFDVAVLLHWDEEFAERSGAQWL